MRKISHLGRGQAFRSEGKGLAILIGVLALVFLLGIAAVVGYMKFGKGQVFRAKVRMELDRPAFESSILAVTEEELKTQYKIILSEENLGAVVDRFKLIERWKKGSREEAIRLLRERMEVSGEPSGAIEIVFRSIDREEATEVATGLAEQYAAQRRGLMP
ncbi:MAG: hypothetical protein AAF514_18725 [Verrucomicrobiota bacterium]